MITFVIPAYNEEALIAGCIQSIVRETVGVVHEIIVVDNCSTDRTADVAQSNGVTVISETSKGITRARQAGFKAAKYNIIAFIDADSELPELWLHYALKAIEPFGVVAASGPVSYYELALHKRAMSFMFYVVAKAAHLVWPMLQGGNFILKKEYLFLAGGFNTAIDFYGEDTDTAMRLSKVGLVVFDLDMWIYTSARRMTEEGLIRVGARYIANYVWMWLFDKPWSTDYRDHRSN